MTTKERLESLVSTDLDKQLVARLYKITDTTESYLDDADLFVAQRFVFLDTQDMRKKLLDYIEQHDITDAQDVHEIECCILDQVEPELVE